jgi:hypothetical protein
MVSLSACGIVVDRVDLFGPRILRKDVEVGTHVNEIRGIDPLVKCRRRGYNF